VILVAAILGLLASPLLDDAGDPVYETPITPVQVAEVERVVIAPFSPVVAVVTSATANPGEVAVTEVAAASAGDLLEALANQGTSPETVRAIVARMTPEQAARAAMALMDRPAELRAIADRLKTENLIQVRAALFAADVAAWARVSEFLFAEVDTNKPWRLGWVDSERERIRHEIQRHGYTPELLKRVEALMIRAAKPSRRGSLKELKLK